MIRLLGAIVITVAAVAFSMANMERVELDFVVIAPTKVRLFFLLLSAFLLGIIVTALVSMISRVRLKSRLRAALARAARVNNLRARTDDARK